MFWTGFTLGLATMAFIGMVTGTTPEKAAQNLRDWRSVIVGR
jgi:hypothetical protein